MEFEKEIEKIKVYLGFNTNKNLGNHFMFHLETFDNRSIPIFCNKDEEVFINVINDLVYNTKSFEKLKELVYKEKKELTFGEKVVGL